MSDWCGLAWGRGDSTEAGPGLKHLQTLSSNEGKLVLLWWLRRVKQIEYVKHIAMILLLGSHEVGVGLGEVCSTWDFWKRTDLQTWLSEVLLPQEWGSR